MNRLTHTLSLFWLCRAISALVLTGSLCLHAQVGSSASNPGISAKDILANDGSASSGAYFIRPEGPTTSAFLAYADMTFAGGGWTLAVSSVTGAEPTSNDITANTGGAFFSPTGAGTRDLTALAVDTTAQIRFVVKTSTATFDGYFTGTFGPSTMLPTLSSWTVVTNTNSASNLLSANFGQTWKTTGALGTGWYYDGPGAYGTTPSFPGNGTTQGPANYLGTSVTSFQIYVRELVTPSYSSIPEPSTYAAIFGGVALLGAAIWRRRRRS